MGIALCFAAAVVIAGTYTLTNYRKSGQQDEQEQQADSTKKKDSNSKVSAKSANTDKLTIDTENQNDEKQDQKMEQNKSEEDNQSTEGTDQSGTGSVATSGSGTSYHFTEDSELLWPVDGQVIMNYSMDKTVYFSTLDQFKYNPALIISGAEGDQVIAGAAGIVKSIDVTAQTGTTVNLDLGNGYELLIGQLKEVPLNVGDTVEANTVVGYVSKPTKYYSLEGCNVILCHEERWTAGESDRLYGRITESGRFRRNLLLFLCKCPKLLKNGRCQKIESII